MDSVILRVLRGFRSGVFVHLFVLVTVVCTNEPKHRKSARTKEVYNAVHNITSEHTDMSSSSLASFFASQSSLLPTTVMVDNARCPLSASSSSLSLFLSASSSSLSFDVFAESSSTPADNDFSLPVCSRPKRKRCRWTCLDTLDTSASRPPKQPIRSRDRKWAGDSSSFLANKEYSAVLPPTWRRSSTKKTFHAVATQPRYLSWKNIIAAATA